MANQDNANVFSVVSSHKVPNAKHMRHQSKLYSPEEFLALPMVQEFIKNNPDQYFVDEETGEQMMAQELAELYCSVNNGKKMKKALRRAFGEKK
ncbi:hypothetical protein MX551_004032 [Salmonella enterica]|uniref:Uncharacterized protein n=2 Tax=Salmonella enterica TaxID=28901 RepID=A0A5Y0RYH6_SALNE|nr:hypothetical protein [Salmonella enterica subsp. enterica serovar Redlands]EAW2933667.1 hypothetical protein [Salmonella enterica]EBS4088775.1 hypothetical protein [Salmonella enterica subsp. enterica serovar Newport]EBW8393997.1 hypothetical protein [Salmonella enterica subsp. enterica serovar Florida]ECF6076915.1 hypothetical protein [Salmonella enterica subsp. houtenae]ECI4530317.1 hypothetical protein [Salmonella enterica subsp. diarizonae]EKQ9924482.1 hypothetical protein [Salmonella 